MLSVRISRHGRVLGRARWTPLIALLVACGDTPMSGGGDAGGTGEPLGSTSTTPGDSTDGLDSSSGEPEPEPEPEPDEDDSCFAEQWRWVEALEPSRALAVAHGETTALLHTDGAGGELRLSTFDADGALVVQPMAVADGHRGDVAAGPDGEWWLLASAEDGDRLLRRSSDGAALVDHFVSPSNLHGGLATIAMTPDGDAVLGGSSAATTFGQTRLLRIGGDGTVHWEYAGVDDTVGEIVVDPDGTVFAMTILTKKEGADVSVVSLDPDGAERWSLLVGSHGGFGDERASPFGLGLDGNGGFVTLGAEPGAEIPVAPWNTPNVLTERYDGSGEPGWQTEAALTGADAMPTAGAITGVADVGFVAAVEGDGPTMVLLDFDGSPRCQRQLSEDLSIVSMVATSGDTVVVAGRDRGESLAGHTWVAQFRAVADR